MNSTSRRKVIAERDGKGWLVLLPDGSVTWQPSKRAVLALVKATAKADIDITELEWRG